MSEQQTQLNMPINDSVGTKGVGNISAYSVQ